MCTTPLVRFTVIIVPLVYLASFGAMFVGEKHTLAIMLNISMTAAEEPFCDKIKSEPNFFGSSGMLILDFI